jgi:unsaturated rhamnogalacturonyl hydrolase
MMTKAIFPAALILSFSTVATAGEPRAVWIKAANPTPAARRAETVTVRTADIQKFVPALAAEQMAVANRAGKRIASRLIDSDADQKPDALTWQADFAAGATEIFVVAANKRRTTERERPRSDASASPILVSLSQPLVAEGGVRPWSVRIADSTMERTPVLSSRWSYESGVVLRGIEEVWRDTGDAKYLEFIKSNVDMFVGADGSIEGYRLEAYDVNGIAMGKALFPLLAESKNEADRERYRKAAALIRSQFKTHPRVSEGGLWTKQIYPHQMWLDAIYMASAFLARFGQVFGDPAALDDATNEIIVLEKHARDARTGLLYHGWDESRQQRWADSETGTSPSFWGRGMGWWAMALVDVLDCLPEDHPRRTAVIDVLRRTATAVAAVQSKSSGIWYQVLDAEGRDKNYAESSASAMFVYALAKGVRRGYLDKQELGPVIARGWQGLLDRFVEIDPSGQIDLTNVCTVAGLGGNPYRDGSYEYYTSGTRVATNDPKGVGPFILAASEVERLQAAQPCAAKGKHAAHGE